MSEIPEDDRHYCTITKTQAQYLLDKLCEFPEEEDEDLIATLDTACGNCIPNSKPTQLVITIDGE